MTTKRLQRSNEPDSKRHFVGPIEPIRRPSRQIITRFGGLHRGVQSAQVSGISGGKRSDVWACPSPACLVALVVRRAVLKSLGRRLPTHSPLTLLTPAALMLPHAPIAASAHYGSPAATLE
jgi:tetrahydromethanopterin S-methyltransferase subunit F